MRVFCALLLLASSPSTVSTGCTPRSERPHSSSSRAHRTHAKTYSSVELHTWAEGDQYWVTRLEPGSGCVSNETLDPRDGILHIVRDCSLAALVQPRVDELIALFELDPEPQVAGERIADGPEGHGLVFVRDDGSRWVSDAKLLRHGAELLDRDTSEWLLLGPQQSALPPTPAGWIQLALRDQDQVLERSLDSDGRWSCESWVIDQQTLEHVILIRRGRLAPKRAAELIDGFASGLEPAQTTEAKWSATLVAADPDAGVELQGAALVRRWDAFAAEIDRDCVLDPPPTAAR